MPLRLGRVTRYAYDTYTDTAISVHPFRWERVTRCTKGGYAAPPRTGTRCAKDGLPALLWMGYGRLSSVAARKGTSYPQGGVAVSPRALLVPH